jgi:hypothetical protein
MSRAGSVSLSKFDDFLFAPIGEERNGMLLSVLSALARQDVDPWEEAATLARLPGESATQRLALLIAGLPDAVSAQRDSGKIAARLIALLPGRADVRADVDVASGKMPRGAGSKARPGAGPTTLIGTRPKPFLRIGSIGGSRIVVVGIILALCLLAAQCVIGSQQPPAGVEDSHAPASSAVIQKMPSIASD